MARRNSSASSTPRAAVRLVLRTLGALEAVSETESGERLGRFAAGKPLSLLVYLAHSPNRAAPRDHLVELLWGDVDVDSARHALRQTIWYVRRTLGDGVLATDGDIVRLAAWCDSDALDFLRAVDAHDEDKALQLYAGDFLPGIAIPGGAEFERWADFERLRLRAIFTRTSESRVLSLLGRGEARAALPVARRARDIDPGDERLWRRLLEVHIADRDLVGATAEAEAFERQWLAEDREIDATTRALLRRARSAGGPHGDERSSSRSESSTLAVALVGRAAEFAALTTAWDDVQHDGRARHVHITAPAGLGKTRLLLDFRARMRASRSRTVLVRANPGERSVPYALIATLAQALAELPGAAAIAPAAANVLVRLNPALSSHFPEAAGNTVEQEPLRRRTVAIRELAVAVADERAVAVLVDDLHWADRESSAVLAALAGNFGEGRLLLVTSARGRAGQWFAHEPHELALEPLDPRAIAEMVASLARLPDEAWADQLPPLLLGATNGSPLLALETLQLAMERGLLQIAQGEWRCTDAAALTALLADTNPLAKRVGQVDAASRALLVLLSAAGVPCSTHTLAQAATMAPEGVEGQLQALEVRGLVQRADELWIPAHDEIAASMLATLEATAVSRARLAVARAVVSDPSADLGALRVAAELLVASGESGELAELFARFTRVRERAGVHVSGEEHLRALIGESLPAPTRRRVLRSAPWRARISRRMLGLSLLLGGALGGGWWWTRATAAPLSVHLVGIETDSTTPAPVELLLPANLDLGAGVIELTRRGRPSRLPLGAEYQDMSPSLDGSGWYARQTFPDTGSGDVVFVARNGTVTRLENSPGDDGPAMSNPDGTLLAMNTSRFSPTMQSMTGIMDLKRRQVRLLARTTDHMGPVAWHSDGSLLLVEINEAKVGGGNRSCALTLLGEAVRCFEEWLATGWVTGSRFLAVTLRAPRTLASIDVTTGNVRPLCDGIQFAFVSPGGEWVVVRGEKAGWDGAVYWLARTNDPCEGAVLVHRGAAVRALRPVYDVMTPMERWIDTLRIISPDSLASITPVRLSVTGRTRAGRPVSPVSIQWSSLDTSVAAITADGLLVPRADGHARVVASAGGWRVDTATITIRQQVATLLQRSTFRDSAALADWYLFGTPLPRLTTWGSEQVLSLNGDSSYSSGIRLRQPLSVGAGLAARVRLRLKVTATQWQNVGISFMTAAPNAAWDAWDRRTGANPQSANPSLDCAFGYPAGEGASAMPYVTYSNHVGIHRSEAPPQVRAGEWSWAEVQLLPDGRCGVAIDGRVIGMTEERQPGLRPVEFKVNGYSHRALTLVDSVELYRGVLHPAWWSAFDVARLRAPRAPDDVTAPPARGRSSPPSAVDAARDRGAPPAAAPRDASTRRALPR